MSAEIITQNRSLTTATVSRDVALPDESLTRYAAAGWITLAIFFGGFGLWAATAPLNGAVVANAVVRVEGNRKSVQHLDGGIVKQLNIKEGDRVATGQVLIRLDDTQARANFDVLSQQDQVLLATDARLTAEFKGDTTFTPPDNLSPNDAGIWEAQSRQFQSDLAALSGQQEVLGKKIEQLNAQTDGDQNQIAAFQRENGSLHQELAQLGPLVQQGWVSKTRQNQLERTGYGVESQIAEATADIARARQSIAEQEKQIAELQNQHMADVSKDLQDTQSKLLDVIPRLSDAKAVLERTDIRAPYSGRIVNLSVFGVGAVIGKGEKILDIVPDNDGLTVDARVDVGDISDVHPGMIAEVHLTAYKQRITPVVHGTVSDVSADRLTDDRTGAPYYSALVKIDPDELKNLPAIQLYPGMPATVQIPTVKRTALDYLVGPLTASFSGAFRQK